MNFCTEITGKISIYFNYVKKLTIKLDYWQKK